MEQIIESDIGVLLTAKYRKRKKNEREKHTNGFGLCICKNNVPLRRVHTQKNKF